MVCFFFQFFCSVQEFETVLAIEVQHALLVVCIHDDKTASRLVVRVYEPGGYVFYDLRTYRISAALEIFRHAEPAYQNGRLASCTLGVGNLPLYLVSGRVGNQRSLDAVVGQSEGTDDFILSTSFGGKEIGLPQQLAVIKTRLLVEEIIEFYVTATERIQLFFSRDPVERTITLQKDSFLHVPSYIDVNVP